MRTRRRLTVRRRLLPRRLRYHPATRWFAGGIAVLMAVGVTQHSASSVAEARRRWGDTRTVAVARHRIPIATYGHIAGGGLHPGHLIDGRDPDEVQRVLRVADDIHQLALRMGGTTTGEHGVGAARAPYMAQEHGPALQVMRRLKQALDPHGIMNPGVIFDPLPLPFDLPLGATAGEPTLATIDPG